MSKPKFTPGPWRITYPGNTKKKWVNQLWIENNEHAHIVDDKGVRGWEVDQSDYIANAQVIAAAPEMLEAIKIIVSAYGRTDGSQQTMLALAVKNAISLIKEIEIDGEKGE